MLAYLFFPNRMQPAASSSRATKEDNKPKSLTSNEYHADAISLDRNVFITETREAGVFNAS